MENPDRSSRGILRRITGKFSKEISEEMLIVIFGEILQIVLVENPEKILKTPEEY